jgi:hypothetical protein
LMLRFEQEFAGNGWLKASQKDCQAAPEEFFKHAGAFSKLHPRLLT